MLSRPLAACTVICLFAAGCQTSSPYSTARDAGWNHFGPVTEVEAGPVALGAIGGDEKNIVVEGTVVETCETSGCWARIVADDGHELFILCEQNNFHLPTNSTGHRLVAHGDVQTKVITVEERKHFAEVSGASAEEIAAITEPETMYMLIADSVYLEGIDLVEAYTPEEAKEMCEAEHGEEK